MNLTDALRGLVSTECLAQLTQAINMGSVSGVETKTSGACTPGIRTTKVSVTGTNAYSLADGTFQGQRHTFICTVAASTPVGTLTPAHMTGGTSVLFDAVNEQLELEWSGTTWHVVGVIGATVS